MVVPKLLFRALENSYCVVVQNLELLSVRQIQEFQIFVEKRSGYFDFETFTFCIQKRITFRDFSQLLDALGMKANVVETVVKTTNPKQITFGKYKGMLYSELPDSYLLWLKKNYSGVERDVILSEMKTRGI